jgi:hypothetical protein
MRCALALLCSCLAAAAVAASAKPAGDGAFTLRGKVSYVFDGDTISVRLDSGRRERVRPIGIDTPERGACLAGKARTLARELATGERVLLLGDPPRTPATATAACSPTPGCTDATSASSSSRPALPLCTSTTTRSGA